MRDGDWKLHGFPGSRLPSQSTIDFIAEAQLVRFELHNLRDDPAETTNLAEAEKARTERMANALIALYRETQKEGERWAEKALPKDRE
ncbi:MAG: hypothetical protein BWZ10_02414 [candidate division BRC1 bacterium ADurb.BinA364]|nr:MAG: hypothetical protein BWZ10_02414 [candidate division BRC1 bacterium ADurb.BinA364]